MSGAKKNDKSITFYNGEEKVMFLEYVNSIPNACRWVESKGIIWTHAMIYNRKTREKLDRIINPKKD